MTEDEKIKILMVDDQPSKLLSYESILNELGETLIKAGSGREALDQLLKTDIAVVLMDVSMPEIDGFQLAEIIHQHPRYQKTAIIFISAVHLSDLDRLKGYERGAVDYISVPVIPELLRAKVSVYAELRRKTRQLERLNDELERRVAERTRELEEREQQLKGSLQEKEVMLKEIHHRVKNNLQVISSLLNLQADHVGEPRTQALLAESRNRVRAMALVHQLLYESTDFARVQLGDFLRRLAPLVATGLGAESRGIRTRIEADEAYLDLHRAVPCGLLVNELITNAFRHAFPGGRSGEVSIRLCNKGSGWARLTVRDNGVGLPAGIDHANLKSLGLRLVVHLADQIGGTLAIGGGPGARFDLDFRSGEEAPS